jgi:hypothetical protein
MIEITNTLFQPLTLQATSGAGVHLPPRGRLQIPETDVSEEMRRAARRGFIRLQQATAVLPGLVDDDAVSKAGKRKES